MAQALKNNNKNQKQSEILNKSHSQWHISYQVTPRPPPHPTPVSFYEENTATVETSHVG